MTPAALAREKAGLTPEAAAQQARISVGYLRQIERSGRDCSYRLATRLARLYGCSANVFLLKSEGRQTPGSHETKKKPAAPVTASGTH